MAQAYERTFPPVHSPPTPSLRVRGHGGRAGGRTGGQRTSNYSALQIRPAHGDIYKQRNIGAKPEAGCASPMRPRPHAHTLECEYSSPHLREGGHVSDRREESERWPDFGEEGKGKEEGERGRGKSPNMTRVHIKLKTLVFPPVGLPSPPSPAMLFIGRTLAHCISRAERGAACMDVTRRRFGE